MIKTLDKKLIKKRFEKSLPTYADNAVVQKQMAVNLLSELIKYRGRQFENILDIGCGCGFLTENILNNLTCDNLFINDMVEEAVNKTADFSRKIKKIYGDCETISFPANLDLIISNATFQWIFDFEELADKIHSSLKKDGILAFTTFGELNLSQMKSLTGKGLKYYRKSDIEKILDKKFEIIYSHSDIINIEFKNTIDMLKHLKFSGANSIEETKWSKKDLADFVKEYEKFKNKTGKVELTYQPLYFIARKK
ncbi:MAG: malonyl-ACP O-methyltransferase BioC [Candidatus Gastranaerophilales bacterium]|nr:malonyl-ACP O-methyltransferase BioC [Candidatus Gastranaerophilales bacterium]